MAVFGNFIVTNDGLDLLLKVQTGEELNFTKFVLGDGNAPSNPATLHNVVNTVRNESIKRLHVQTTTTNKKVAIGFNIDPSQLVSGFYLREIGIFAEDPDGGNDILVYYGNAGDTADYIAPASSGTISEKLIDIEIYISNADSITAVIDSSLVYATQSDLQALQSIVNTKTANYIKEITSTTITPSSFQQSGGYYTVTITDNDIKSGNYVDFNVSDTSYEVAVEAEMQGYTICGTGYFTLKCKNLPTGNITGNYTIIGGD